MRIGIHVAWSRQESAYMAGQLADVAAGLGHSVSILSSVKPDGPVYGRWDAEVAGPSVDFRQWVRKQRTVVWFDCQPEKLRNSQAAGCRNLLVLLWQRISVPELPLLPAFTKVICPSKAVIEHAIRAFPQGNYLLAEWDTQTVPVATAAPEKDAVRVFVPLDAAAARRHGPLIISSLQMVAEHNPRIRFTLGRCGPWSRPALQALTSASRALPKRFKLIKRRSWHEWEQTLRAHDWLFNASCQENVGLTNLAAAYLRIPTAAFDVSPVDDLIRDGKTGMLVPCDVAENPWGVPAAVPSPRKLVDVLDVVLADSRLGRQLAGDATQARLLRRRTTFREFWERELEKLDPWA